MGANKRDLITMHALGEYLKYWWKAKTRHGIHSPFVYRFIEQGLKTHRPLNDIIKSYFKDFRQVWVDDITKFADKPLPSVTKDTVLVITGIHFNKQQTAAWEKLIADPAVKLSIDLYRCGLLFFREESREKQHFMLKFPL